MSDATLLRVEDLRVRAAGADGPVTIVAGVDFVVRPREVLGIAGESGSGKTMTVLTLLGLQPANVVVTGRAHLDGRDLLRIRGGDLRSIRGNDVAMVFQDPVTALHPMLPIGTQMTEHARRHLGIRKAEASRRAVALLEEVRIPNARAAMKSYPHQFSGGMRQRLVIAMALMCEPRLLIADEPTTALDVTVQAGILQLFDQLRRDHNMAVILVTHDLGVMSSLADRVAVFYAGRIVEEGDTNLVLQHPQHPYTKRLLMALPDSRLEQRLTPIPGSAAGPEDRPPGCSFHPRCDHAIESCAVGDPPPLDVVADGWLVACPVRPFATDA